MASEKGVAARALSWLALLGYVGLLVYLSLRYGRRLDPTDTPLWGLQDSHQLFRWIGAFALRELCRLVFYIPLGSVVTMLVAGSLGRLPRILTGFSALFMASGLAVGVRSLEMGWSWHSLTVAGLVLPLLGCLLGVWIGSNWLRGWGARLWLIPKLVGLLMVTLLCSGFVFWLLVEARPLSFTSVPVTSEEKRRLVDLIRSKSPRTLQEGETEALRLTEHDVDVLLAWGLSLGSANRKAKVDFTADLATMQVSVGVPLGRGRTRYLNLLLTVHAEMTDRRLDIRIHQCRLGSLDLPQGLLDFLSPRLASLLSHWRLSRPFVDATKDIAIRPGLVEVTYGRVSLRSDGIREELFGSSVLSHEVLAATRAQVDNLLVLASRSTGAPLGFDLCLESVFALARDRSITSDPVTENRGGIFAMGILLGHRRFEAFLGPVIVNHSSGRAQRALRRVRLRGRSDWTKHFCLSAAICLLSDERVSDAAGLLKEELDAGVGGSGFSFADLLADQAGTTFATLAVRDATTARALQDRLARGFRVDDYFPQAADLPEGISAAELQSQYGGVGGAGYTQLMAEMKRRIADCAAYRVLRGLSP